MFISQYLPCGIAIAIIASEPHRRDIFDTTSSIFVLWFRPWDVARLFVSVEFLRAPIPRKEPGTTTTEIKTFVS